MREGTAASGRTTLQERVYALVLRRIIDLTYPPGYVLDVADLMAKLETGRTPIRETLLILKFQGIVTAVPRRGTAVSSIDPDLVRQQGMLRSATAREVVRMCCMPERHDISASLEHIIRRQRRSLDEGSPRLFIDLELAFRRMLFQSTGHASIWNSLASTCIDFDRTRYASALSPHADLALIHRDLSNLADSIRRGDAEGADGCVRRLATNSLASLDRTMASFPDLFASPSREEQEGTANLSPHTASALEAVFRAAGEERGISP